MGQLEVLTVHTFSVLPCQGKSQDGCDDDSRDDLNDDDDDDEEDSNEDDDDIK